MRVGRARHEVRAVRDRSRRDRDHSKGENADRPHRVLFGKKRVPEGSKESRVDLALLEEPIASRAARCLRGGPCTVKMKYETKAGQLFDFAPEAETDEKYLGAALDKDMRGLKLGC